VDDHEYSLSDEVIAAVDSGNKIKAIKLLREETGLGLKEAKDLIDALAAERRGDPPIAAAMSEEGGAGGMIKMVIAIAAILAIYFYFFAG